METITMITTIAVALITAVFGPNLRKKVVKPQWLKPLKLVS